MGDIIVLLTLAVIFILIFRYLYAQHQLAKKYCKGISCLGCSKLLDGCGESKDILSELRKEYHKKEA
jgi:hypothetical protein